MSVNSLGGRSFGRRTSVPSTSATKGFGAQRPAVARSAPPRSASPSPAAAKPAASWSTPRENPMAESADFSEIEMLAHFMGENAEKFLRLRKDFGPRTYFSFNLAAFLAPMAWLFYRKMYAFGAMLLLAPIALVMVFPALAEIPSIGLAGAIAAVANSAYLGFATKRVRKLKDQAMSEGLSEDEFIDLLESKGGVSVAGAVFGVMITLSLVALPFIAAAGG